MEIQSITNVVSIHKSIESLTHLIDHSYRQAWSALLAAAILKISVVHFMLDNMNGLLGELNLLYSYELILHSTHMFRRLFRDLLSMGWRGCASAMGAIKLPPSCSSPKIMCQSIHIV